MGAGARSLGREIWTFFSVVSGKPLACLKQRNTIMKSVAVIGGS